MADEDNANDLGDGLEGDAPAGKKGGVKGAFPQLLKMILIGVAAIIFIVTIVVVTTAILNKGGNKQTAIPVSEEYTTKREVYDWYTSLDQIRIAPIKSAITEVSPIVPAVVPRSILIVSTVSPALRLASGVAPVTPS